MIHLTDETRRDPHNGLAISSRTRGSLFCDPDASLRSSESGWKIREPAGFIFSLTLFEFEFAMVRESMINLESRYMRVNKKSQLASRKRGNFTG